MTRILRKGRRDRSALLWALASLVVAQVGLMAALSGSWNLRDPEYAVHLAALRTRLAEAGPGRPLVLLIGSSHLGMNVRPGLLAANRPGVAEGPLVFNFGLCGAGPVQELLSIRRLLADGIRPDFLLVDLAPELLYDASGDRNECFPVERLAWREVKALAPYCHLPREMRRCWLRKQLLPWYELRQVLLDRWLPLPLLSQDSQAKSVAWRMVDPWGWLAHPVMDEGGPELQERRRTLVFCRGVWYAVLAEHAPISPVSKQALQEVVQLCREEKIRLAFILTPDAYYRNYPPQAARRQNERLGELAEELGVSVIDARNWLCSEDFHDTVHLTFEGARRFTQRLDCELGPHLAGEPFERRWPPGRLVSASLPLYP
jgi:hypothetical protein